MNGEFQSDPLPTYEDLALNRVVWMMTLLLWALLAGVCAVAFWIALLVKGLNHRFDQIEHKLDVIVDHLDTG